MFCDNLEGFHFSPTPHPLSTLLGDNIKLNILLFYFRDSDSYAIETKVRRQL